MIVTTEMLEEMAPFLARIFTNEGISPITRTDAAQAFALISIAEQLQIANQKIDDLTDQIDSLNSTMLSGSAVVNVYEGE